MKILLRTISINVGALWLASQVMPSLTITGGFVGYLLGATAFMFANILLTPLIKVLLLPLNLLTLGIFAWLSNVLILYLLTKIVPNFQLSPYYFPGISYEGFVLPPMDLSAFHVAIVVSFLIGFTIHLTNWLIKA